MKRLITLELPLPLTGAQEAIIGELVQDAVHKLQSTGLHDLRILFQTRESLEAVKSTYDAGKHYVMMLGETLAKKVIKYFNGTRPDKSMNGDRDLYDRAEQLLGGENAVADDKTLAACKTRFNNRENFCGAPDSIPAFDYQISGQITHSMRSNAEHVRASLKYAIIADVPNVAQVNNRDALLRLLDEIEATGEVNHSYDETMIVELGKTAYNYLRDRMQQMVDDRFASICYGLYEALTTARDGLTKHRAKPEVEQMKDVRLRGVEEIALLSEIERDLSQIMQTWPLSSGVTLKMLQICERINSHLGGEAAEKVAAQSSAVQPKKSFDSLLLLKEFDAVISGLGGMDSVKALRKKIVCLCAEASSAISKDNPEARDAALNQAIRLSDHARRVLRQTIAELNAGMIVKGVAALGSPINGVNLVIDEPVVVDNRVLAHLLDLIERYVS